MNENAIRQRIIVAAAQLFLRYGFDRTKMGEIASVTGISRPTLYANFPGKEDVFEAAVLHLNALRHAAIARTLANLNGLEVQLNATFELWLLEVYHLQQRSPDAKDMDDLSLNVVQKVYADLTILIADLIAAQVPIGSLKARKLARVIVFSLRGLGVASRDADDFHALAQENIRLFCGALAHLHPAQTCNDMA